MVEPRYQPVFPSGRYSGVKEPLIRNWDRNKARIDSIHQLPTRDFRQTAAQFGVPSSIADLNTNERGVPKMECTTTTKSDYCRPTLDRYMTVPGVCPALDYPSSSGLEYCPGRPQEPKPNTEPVSTPAMPRTKSTCPASLSSLKPSVSAVPKLNHPPTIPQYPVCSADDTYVDPLALSRNHSFGSNDVPMKSSDYTPQVDYCSKQPNFKWPNPVELGNSYSSRPRQEPMSNFDSRKTPEMLQIPDFQGGGESFRNHLNYPVETEDHAEDRILHDEALEKARKTSARLVGSPGSTVPLMKAGVDPPSAVAHYNVPDYTQGATAGGIVRPRFGAPNVEMKVPITDPSYPRADNRVPPPEAGLTKMGYNSINDEAGGKPGVAYTPPVRYPDKIYNSPPGHVQAGGNADVPRPPLINSGEITSGRYIPSIIETQEGESKLTPISNAQSHPTPGNNDAQPNADSNEPKLDNPSLKGVRRIQTTNQVYGSWIDDPYLKDNDWWFKAKAKMPHQKTDLTRYKEENGWY